MNTGISAGTEKPIGQRTYQSRHFRWRWLLVGLATLSVLVYAGIAGKAWARVFGGFEKTQQEKPEPQRLGGISVNLTRFGFEPSKITIPEGKFYIHIQNLTSIEEPVYSIFKDKNKGEKLDENRQRKGATGLDKVLNFKEGDYALIEASHPTWELSIKVFDPKKQTGAQ